MTEDEAIEKIRALAGSGDIETMHFVGDDVLCDFLKSLGYHRLVKAWDELDKWYA